MTLAGSSVQTWNGNFTFVGSNPSTWAQGYRCPGVKRPGDGGQQQPHGERRDQRQQRPCLEWTRHADLDRQQYLYGRDRAHFRSALLRRRHSSSGSVALGGGTLQYACGNTQDISSRLLLPSGTATIDTNGNNVTFASSFGGGSGSLVKIGSGAIALTPANTFTGNTTINGGTLQLNVQGNGGSPECSCRRRLPSTKAVPWR